VAVALAEAFARTWRDKEGHGVEEWPCGREANVADVAMRVAGTKPDVVLLAVPAARFRTLRSRLASAGVAAPLLYGGEDAGWSLLQAELEAGPEVLLATAYPPAPTTDLGKDFARRYQDAFHEPADLFAAQSYDAVRLLFQAMSEAQTFQGKELVGQLQQTESFETVSGKVSWQDRRPRRTLFLVRLDGARRELIRTCPPEER
jgi:branched-chain amino acid transport system substrate-binding protein